MITNDVLAGIAANANAITGLTALDYTPDSVEPPMFFPVPIDVEYDLAMSRGLDRITMTWRVLVSRTDDRASQRLLNSYLDGVGSTSLKAAISSDLTLGGACHNLRLERAEGNRFYEHNGIKFLGAQVVISATGRGN